MAVMTPGPWSPPLCPACSAPQWEYRLHAVFPVRRRVRSFFPLSMGAPMTRAHRSRACVGWPVSGIACCNMSIVVRGVRPHVDAGRVSAARPVSASAAAGGLRLADDVKRLLERAEHVLLEESDVDVERLLAPVLPLRPGEVGEEVLDEGTLDRRPPPAALGASQQALGTGDPRVGARLAHLRTARDVQAGGAHLLALEVLQQLRLRECPPLEVHQVLGPAGE